MRKDCILTQLTDEQKDQLYDWLCESTYAEVQTRLAQPPPLGFSIEVHRNTLSRFYTEYSLQLRHRTLAELRISNNDPSDSASLFAAAKSALAYSTYRLAHSPTNATSFNELSRAVYRHEMLAVKQSFLALAEQHAAIARERTDIERERLKLEEVKFRFDASKEAALRALKIKETLKTPGVTTEDKVWAVSEMVFGPSNDRARYHSQSPNPPPADPPSNNGATNP